MSRGIREGRKEGRSREIVLGIGDGMSSSKRDRHKRACPFVRFDLFSCRGWELYRAQKKSLYVVGRML